MGMEHIAEFLDGHIEEIMLRFEARLRQAHAQPEASRSELREGLPRYLRYLARIFRPSGTAATSAAESVQAAAEEHGEQRLQLGFDPGSVVREYGYLYESIFQLALEHGFLPSSVDMSQLADHINLASSQAVAQYAHLRDEQLRQQAARHRSFLAHELRSPLSAAFLASQILLSSSKGSSGKADAALQSSLSRLRDLIDLELTSGLLDAGAPLEHAVVSVHSLLMDAIGESELYAQTKEIRFVIEAAEGLTVEGDERLLRSAINNLVRNAVKFTPHGTITLRAQERGDRVRVEIEDGCGGLPPGQAEAMFQPFVQVGKDRSGFGLGLAITRHAIEAHQGTVVVSDLPGKGCVLGFEIPSAVG